jgi:Ca-activated chloride channel family protein
VLFSEFHFLRPLWLIAIPLFWWMVFRLLSKWWRKGEWDKEVDPHLLEFLATSPLQQKRRLLPWAMCFAGTLLLLSLSGPVWQKKTQPLLKKTQARVLVLDLSYSMLAADIKPTRIERARYKLEDLLNRFVEGETALVGYAGEAFVISPLTHDPLTISALLPGLHPNIMPVPGSRPELAVGLATELLNRSRATTGHIILITDGIEESEISAVIKNAGSDRLTILAVGTESGSPIALPAGGFLKDKNGAIVIPKLNMIPLKKLVDQTQGELTVLSPDDQDVDTIISVETSAVNFVEDQQQRTADMWNEEGPWLLLLVLPLTALLFRRGVLFSLGIIVFTSVFASPSMVMAFGWDDLWLRPDRQASKLFEQGETKQASELFENDEWKGAAAYRSGDYQQAIDQFSKQDNPRANFNRGNALAFAGRLQDALKAYQQVLSDDPQHQDAQFNKELIEELLKKQQKKQQQNKQNKQDKKKQQQQRDSSGNQDQSAGDPEQKPEAEKNESDKQQSKDSQDKMNEQKNEDEKDERNKKDEKDKFADKQNNQKSADQSKQQNIAVKENSDLTPEDRSRQQTMEQWLRKIPDDPGRLLRNKMKREYQRRSKKQNHNKQYW